MLEQGKEYDATAAGYTELILFCWLWRLPAHLLIQEIVIVEIGQKKPSTAGIVKRFLLSKYWAHVDQVQTTTETSDETVVCWARFQQREGTKCNWTIERIVDMTSLKLGIKSEDAFLYWIMWDVVDVKHHFLHSHNAAKVLFLIR